MNHLTLTDRQQQVLERTGRGMTQVEIARELGISQPAVCKHLRRARLKRLGFPTRCDTVDPAVIDETKIKATL